MANRDLGDVTAYAIAVKYGYAGSEAQWIQDILRCINIPDAPEIDGTYTLQCTVTEGVATYDWVSGE